MMDYSFGRTDVDDPFLLYTFACHTSAWTSTSLTIIVFNYFRLLQPHRFPPLFYWSYCNAGFASHDSVTTRNCFGAVVSDITTLELLQLDCDPRSKKYHCLFNSSQPWVDVHNDQALNSHHQSHHLYTFLQPPAIPRIPPSNCFHRSSSHA
jgi:hypothetical protein